MLPEAAKYKKEWQKRQRSLIKSDSVRSYLYVHLEADSGKPFYVGIGKTPNRPWDCDRSTKHQRRAKKHGNRVEILDFPQLSWEAAKWWEIRWIKALRDSGYKLTNITDGGDSNPMDSDDAKARQKANVPRGEAHYSKTEEAKENLRAKNTGKKYTQETNRKKGRTGPKEISESGLKILKRPKSDQTKGKMSNSAFNLSQESRSNQKLGLKKFLELAGEEWAKERSKRAGTARWSSPSAAMSRIFLSWDRSQRWNKKNLYWGA